jgi:hypothetical protein
VIDWKVVAKKIEGIVLADEKLPIPPKKDGRDSTVAYQHLDVGQRKSLRIIAQRLPQNGIIIADEVGMGKTRIATTLTKAVIEAGGRVAILVPPGLGPQWGDELRKSYVQGVPEVIRSLNAYLNAWADDKKDHKPWASHSTLIISHAFCNWQVKSNPKKGPGNSNTKKNWKWSLLPQTLALVQAQLRESGRVPRGMKNNVEFKGHSGKPVANAAEWIARESNRQILHSLAQEEAFSHWGSGSPLLDPESYRKHTEYRKGLERVIGLGLGDFDLVVIDEAHKSRGVESNLERLLANVIAPSANARRLAMTATPIELNVDQWQQILERIGVKDESANNAIAKYDAAVRLVRQLPNDKQARKEFIEAAKGKKKNRTDGFERLLGKYLLRRDKREVESVKAFVMRTGKKHSDYRRLSEIAVQTAELSVAWKQAVCAAEALSFVSRGLYGDDGKRLSRGEIEKTKYLRLTLGNGHGISTLMDETQRDKSDMSNDKEEVAIYAMPDDEKSENKKIVRIEWWKSVMSRAFQGDSGQRTGESALYEHPAILAAVDAIETVCRHGEKVLVFGRFTKPMQALVHLLNAREMLRCFESEAPWPQEKVHRSEQTAVEAVLRKRGKSETLKQINEWLSKQYGQLENQRESFRNDLRDTIRLGLTLADLKDRPRASAMFTAFSSRPDEQIAPVARAIHEALADEDLKNPSSVARAFESLITAASDRDDGFAYGDGELDHTEAGQLWSALMERLSEEYGRQEGSFARLMNGNTKPHTRRLLQLAFNREHASPKVLVAQSMVGREGLNLHEACRTVILLHAEWNPGVVEQQIGRVDRLNSLWEKKLERAIVQNSPADALPKIEIRPVIFQGTYDEHNWKVLIKRWDDLRAQLHGIVITPSIAENLPPERGRRINACAPNFSPS